MPICNLPYPKKLRCILHLIAKLYPWKWSSPLRIECYKGLNEWQSCSNVDKCLYLRKLIEKIEELEAPPTYTETFSQNFQLIYADLQLTIPQEIEMYPSPYSETIPVKMKFSLANRMLQRAKRMNNRVLMLTNTFILESL